MFSQTTWPGVSAAEAEIEDAISVLRTLRHDLRMLVERLGETQNGAARHRLLESIDNVYSHHVRIREDLFYSACGRHLDRRAEGHAFGSARDEHGMTKLLLWRMRRDGHDAAAFRRGLTRLQSLLSTETRREEEVLFPLARQVMDPDELRRLGSVIRVRARS